MVCSRQTALAMSNSIASDVQRRLPRLPRNRHSFLGGLLVANALILLLRSSGRDASGRCPSTTPHLAPFAFCYARVLPSVDGDSIWGTAGGWRQASKNPKFEVVRRRPSHVLDTTCTSPVLLESRRACPPPHLAAVSPGFVFSGVGEAFSTIFVSEVGDKTFFLSMILAIRRGRLMSLISSLTALWAMVFISVAIGGALKRLPQRMGDVMVVHVAAAVLMIVFGVQSLREREDDCDGKDEAECDVESVLKQGQRNHFLDWMRFSALIFLAEWGDRSMLATVALAAARSPVGVMLGGCLGHTAAATLAVLGGGILGKYIDEKTMKTIGGGLFIIFGVTTLFGVY